MFVKGIDLNANQRKQVLATFVYRWTHENARQNYYGKCPACAQRTGSGTIIVEGKEIEWHDYHTPLISDTEWLNQYGFHFMKDGSRLKINSQAERIS